MAEKKIRRSINFMLAGGKALSVGVEFSSDPQPVFDLNPFDFSAGHDAVEIGSTGGSYAAANGVGVGRGSNYYKELGVSKTQYTVALLGRELEEISLVYKLGSLPEAEIPNLSDDLAPTELAAAKRDWIWKSARKEVDVLSVDFREGEEPLKDTEGNFLSEIYILGETPTIKSFYGTISMRGVVPFYKQEITPMLPTGWGKYSTPALALRQTPWGNLVDADSVSVVGSYYDIVEVLPKRAVGIIL